MSFHHNIYGSEVWGFKHYDSLEKVQYLACRLFLGVAENAPNVTVLGECGRYPIFFYTAKRCVKYWAKLINMPSHRYPRKCYNMLYLIEESGYRTRKTWVRDVKNLLYMCNLQEFWESQTVGNVNTFVDTFSSNCKHVLFSEWYSEVCTLNKLN